ncbi:MAG: helix-turn-helix transcriptional regulator [Clostridia bacterium]|nr:helix-turn-helix transcriptional regulator [Clostridia bacterium]
MKILRFNESHNITGEQIKRRRKEKGLTQEQVVAQMQVAGIQIDQKAISRIESGDRVITDYELMKMADILGVSVDQLIRDSMYDIMKDEEL